MKGKPALRLNLIILTVLALIAFAGNSVLCRSALGNGVIDPVSFTIIRLVSAAMTLGTIIYLKNRSMVFSGGSWRSAFMLFLYAATFSYAYISLDAGVGALILFGSVQITMIVFNIFNGDRGSITEMAGMMIAFTGLIILLLPGSGAPNLKGFLLMALSGVAWGAYTIRGKGTSRPLTDTANNFLKTVPMCIGLGLGLITDFNVTNEGIYLAIASGAITSGLGYAIWYKVLPELSITRAAISQLTVPVIAAIGGVMFLAEQVSLQLVLASSLTLGGVLLVIINRPAIANANGKN